MKRIVILCDRTWNRSDRRHPTNVVRFAQAMLGTAPDGTVQVPVYIAGVGTGRGSNRFSRRLDALAGGAFGWGLFENIVEAYQHLAFMHEPGDAIHIIGFSRGAYTARSLAGFIRSTGIIPRNLVYRLPDAVGRYRTRNRSETHHPATEESHRFRAELSPGVATSPSEILWRRENGFPEAELLRIEYLGVWDTVGALGVPVTVPILSALTAKRYQFHDADLSSMVKSARHAIALDERRRAFEPARWENLEDLNRESPPQAEGLTPYQELFFAGDHGSVGGGGDIVALSSIGLTWIMEGARAAGLCFDPAELARIGAEEDAMGPLHNNSIPSHGVMARLMRFGARDRKGPQGIADLHPSVIRRWAKPGGAGFEPYRPGSLMRVAARLDEARPEAGEASGTRLA